MVKVGNGRSIKRWERECKIGEAGGEEEEVTKIGRR